MPIALLVAGRGTRFLENQPKCLMDIGGRTLLERTVAMIRASSADIPIIVVTGFMSEDVKTAALSLGDDNLKVIHNSEYESDQNILSVQVAMHSATEEILVLEGDCIFNESSIAEFISRMGNGENVFFTKGGVKSGMANAIIGSMDGIFTGYHKGKRDSGINFSDWGNMAGATLFNSQGIQEVLKWLEESLQDPSSTYYFQPLIEKSWDRPVKVHRLSEQSMFITFNTQFEYLKAMASIEVETIIELVDVNFLKHVEGFSQKRVDWLKDKIIDEGVWNLPICIDGEHGIVMDGQHRMEVAIALDLSVIPAVRFKHTDVDFWSLRESHEVSLDKIMENLESGDTYPYKTVKYGFPFDIPRCSIRLEELR